MTIVAHTLAGLVIEQFFIQKGLIPQNTYAPLIAVTFTNLPDIDVLFSLNDFWNHRKQSPFHMPFLWVLPLGIVAALAFFSGHRDILPFILLASIALLSHFILDSLGLFDGIRWLAPFNRKTMSFFKLHIQPNSMAKRVAQNLRHPVFYVQVAFILSTFGWLTRFGRF